MLHYRIPGRGKFDIENIVLDYNGTIAVDGLILDGVKELISKLKKHANIYILTADTYGTVREACKDLDIEVITFPNENAGENKKKIVKELNGQKTICVGNGYNDILMFEESILSIAVIEGEGASGKLLSNADIVTRSIVDALNIILNENKVAATLRN